MPTLPFDRPPTAVELRALSLDDVRADPLLAEALNDFTSGQPERANALTFYELSAKPPLAEAVERIVGERDPAANTFERPSLRLSPAVLPNDRLEELRRVVSLGNVSTLTTLVRELRADIAARFAGDVLPALYRSDIFNKAIDARIAKANADPVGHLLTAIDAPAEKWDTLKPLLATYYKEALVRDKNLKPEKALISWAKTEKAMLALIKIVPRVKLEPVLRKNKVPYVKPLLLDPDKLIRGLKTPEAQEEALRALVVKFNRLSGKVPLDQVKLVAEIARLCATYDGPFDSPEQVYKAMKLARKL